MPSFILPLIKTRLRVVVVITICFAVVGLWSVVFPSRSGARVKSTSAQQKSSGKRKRPDYVRGEVLVRYRDEAVAKRRTGLNRVTTKEGLEIPVQVERLRSSNLIEGLRLARVPADQTLKAVAALRKQPDVLHAEPNYILKAEVTTPNDPNFAQQYGMTKIGAQTAWDTNQGSKSIVVGIVDQGIDINHEDLASNIWTNPAPGSISGIANDLHGFNFVDDNGTVFSGLATEDHASHVAGIVGAVGNNSKGVSGVNWNVSLMSLKVLDPDGNGSTSDAIDACDYAKAMRDLWELDHTKGANIRVLNASFGGAGFSLLFQTAINHLNDSGILFVTAAGNTDIGTLEPDNDVSPHFPSNYIAPNLIAVLATDVDDQIPAFSHFGATTVDIGAPGVSIISTTPGNTYQSFSGTSMAAPHVSGAAALLWAQNPSLTVAQVKNLLLFNGDIRGALVDKTLTGRRLNVAGSFASLGELNVDVTPPGTVTGLTIPTQTGRQIFLDWTASGENGDSGQASLYLIDLLDGSATIPLRGVMPGTSGTVQHLSVKVPFRHATGTLRVRAFDNVGNEGTPANIPYTIPASIGDPYVPSIGSPAALSTGGNLLPGLNFDDRYLPDFLFPNSFTFPFFGTVFNSVTISTNGALYFSDPPLRDNGDADDVPSSPQVLSVQKMIAGLWDDVDLRTSRRGDAGVYLVQPDANRLIFRWQGVQFESGAPINFEVELRTDGTIKVRYGDGNTGLLPTVGIGAGEPDAYVIRNCADPSTPLPCYTSEDVAHPINLTNAPEVTFAAVAASTPTPTPTPTPSPTPTATPTPAPLQLILEENGPSITQVAALDAMLHVRDLFPVINSANLLNTSPDKNTRVVIFVANLSLLAGEQASAVTVNLVDANGQTFNPPAEDVRAVATHGFAQVIFRLPDNLAVGICSIKVIAHNQTSNTGTIRIRAG